ncbi:MAG TPA: TatD family hydrolase [Parvularculaceae bacterium]|nr:TatD family hydrolase [Parvularculaceae bacterium]
MLIDSHVNLHSDQYADDLEKVIARARAVGVSGMLTISDRLESTSAIKAITDAHQNIWRSVGVHPHHAKEARGMTAETLIELAAERNVVGIGECGLDFHYEYSPRDIQEDVFRAHIAASRATDLPLIIHTREADARMLEILEEEQALGAFTPLLHCYTGGRALAEAVLAMGGYISFSGIITFKNAADIREIARAAPLDRLIVETDCPYLAPIPMRGRRNEPAFVVHVADKLAEIRGASRQEIDRATTENFFRLFWRAHGARA